MGGGCTVYLIMKYSIPTHSSCVSVLAASSYMYFLFNFCKNVLVLHNLMSNNIIMTVLVVMSEH